MKNIDNILLEGELILWEQRPKFITFILNRSFIMILFFMLSLVFYFSSQYLKAINKLNGEPYSKEYMIWVAVIILANPFYKLLSYNKTKFYYTDKRIIIQEGIMGGNIKSIFLEKIISLELKANPFERFFNVGGITFFSGETKMDDGQEKKVYDNLDSIVDYEEVYKELTKLINQKK